MEWAIALVSEDAIFAECLVGEAVWDTVAKKWISMSGFPDCSGEIPISKQVEIIVDGLKRGNSLDIIAQNLMVPLAMFESVLSSFSSVFPCLVNKVCLYILVSSFMTWLAAGLVACGTVAAQEPAVYHGRGFSKLEW